MKYPNRNPKGWFPRISFNGFFSPMPEREEASIRRQAIEANYQGREAISDPKLAERLKAEPSKHMGHGYPAEDYYVDGGPHKNGTYFSEYHAEDHSDPSEISLDAANAYAEKMRRDAESVLYGDPVGVTVKPNTDGVPSHLLLSAESWEEADTDCRVMGCRVMRTGAGSTPCKRCKTLGRSWGTVVSTDAAQNSQPTEVAEKPEQSKVGHWIQTPYTIEPDLLTDEAFDGMCFADEARAFASMLQRNRRLIESALAHGEAGANWNYTVQRCFYGYLLPYELVKSIILMEIIDGPVEKVYHGFVAAGDLNEIMAFEPTLMADARLHGCSKLALSGRPGWVKPLKKAGWGDHFITMSKEVPDGR